MTVYAYGLDVASYQGTPSWSAARMAGYSFVYVKSGEATSPSYPTTAAQVAGARATSFTVGLYHFCRPESSSPESNADALATAVASYNAYAPGWLPPCLDIESGAGDLSPWMRACVARLDDQHGINRVMVYSGLNFWNAHLSASGLPLGVQLWIAQYQAPGTLQFSSPRLAIHQFSASGVVQGISYPADLNAALVPLDQIMLPPEDPMLNTSAYYAKGDVLPDIYLVRYTMGDEGAPVESRRYVGSTEWRIASDQGRRVTVLPQKVFDAIPILPPKTPASP